MKIEECINKQSNISIDEEIELYFDNEESYALQEFLKSFLPWLARTDISLNSLEYIDDGWNLRFKNSTFNYTNKYIFSRNIFELHFNRFCALWRLSAAVPSLVWNQCRPQVASQYLF